VVYVVAIVAALLIWLIVGFGVLFASTTLGVLVLLIAGPIWAFLVILAVRLTLEFSVALIRLVEDTRDIKMRR
jgi:hypothetical protein